MDTTVRDIAALPQFKGMKLLAGAGGLDNVVTRCGFLDYEYEPDMREKYFHRHFDPGEFVLTSFLYAKNNEHQIIDAVKRLHQRRCSGLAIRNIFRLNIRENALRFAEANRFPIFLLTDENFYFEDIIYLVADRVQRAGAIDREARLADQLIHSKLNHKGREALAREINPSLGEELAALFFRPLKSPLEPGQFLAATQGPQAALAPAQTAFYYRGGLMLIHSSDAWRPGRLPQEIQELADRFARLLGRPSAIGISDVHHRLGELGEALKEGLACAALAQGEAPVFHQDMGVYRVFLAAAREPAAAAFSDGLLRPIDNYDNENNTSLSLTIETFVLADGEVKAAARKLNQHENTVRYRLDCVSRLLGLNVLTKSGYETVAAAVKLRLCRQALNSVGI